MPTPHAIVVMGISGCGKTTLGKGIAQALGYKFIEGDDLHPQDNVSKMSAGIALTDEDRWPWLERVAQALDRASPDNGCVVSCSALRHSYRQMLRSRCGTPIVFVFPELSPDLARARLQRRPNHYMPASLVDSQFATLEPPGPEEIVLRIDAMRSTRACLRYALANLSPQTADLLIQPPQATL